MVFQSEASNLVPGDTNESQDVFVRDRATGSTERISVSSSGVQGDIGSRDGVISDDGRYVAFRSWATTFVPEEATKPEGAQIYVHDRQTRTTTHVTDGGERLAGHFETVAISGDGRYVAAGGSWYTHLYDQSTKKIVKRWVGTDPKVSEDGRYTAFKSSQQLVSADTNQTNDVYFFDAAANSFHLVSGTTGSSGAYGPSISADGRYITFMSHSANVVVNDLNNKRDAFLYDRISGSIVRVSVSDAEEEGNGDVWHAGVSSDAQYVAFTSTSNNLVAGDTNGLEDAFLRDLRIGATYRVSEAADLGEPNGWSHSEVADGGYALFTSATSNLVPDDTNGLRDAFVSDGQISRVSMPSDTPTGSILGKDPSTSPDLCYDEGVCPEKNEAVEEINPDSPVPRSVYDAVPRTPRNQVLVVAANVDQTWDQTREAERERAFARRVKDLSTYSAGDGMGLAPDLILLQEVRTADAAHIASYLSTKFSRRFKVAVSDDDARGPSGDGYHTGSDTAILYNARTMIKKRTAHVDTGYPRAESPDCPDGASLATHDLDGNGLLDCGEPTHKRHFLGLFVERKVGTNQALANGQTIAVASVHLIPRHYLKEGARAARWTQWAQKLGDALRTKFAVAEDSLILGGDMNNLRCSNKDRDAPGDYPSAQSCDERTWWATLARGLATTDFADSVYLKHRDVDDRLVPQHKDGCETEHPNQGCDQVHYDKDRIEFIFGAKAPIRRASHDLSCGQDPPDGVAPNCDDPKNPEDYTDDHRLVWALIGEAT